MINNSSLEIRVHHRKREGLIVDMSLGLSLRFRQNLGLSNVEEIEG